MHKRNFLLRFLKKTHSLQFSFLITVISAMLAVTIFIGGLSIYEVDNYVQSETKNLIEITCANEATQINDVFGDMEKSVKIMESYVLSFVEEMTDFADRDKQNEIIDYADKMFVDVAKNTNGAIAYYLRFDPAISDYTSGIFYSIAENGNEYISFPPTDLSIYDKNDTEHVGWFWQPYNAGTPIWMAPYYNQNNHILMISYVIPMYCKNQFIGVVGMDFDYKILSEKVHSFKFYENGVAHLESNGVAVQPDSDKAHLEALNNKEDYLQVSKELINGMTLVLSASYDDIRQIRYEIAFKILFVTLFLATLFSLIVIFFVRKIVKPLKQLTQAATQLSNPNYDVEIIHSNTDEIKLLGTAFKDMAMHLSEHEKLQQLLTYHDSLTGLRNATSYNAWVRDFDQEIKDENISFAIIVLDINYLKLTNDQYGHHAGNRLIVTAAQIISDSFKRSPVFRIGGDEFVVILQNKDLANHKELLAEFDSACEKAFTEEGGIKLPISIAKGMAIYDPKKDTQFADVFNRADKAMYENKRMMKM